jgi:hypothetical protein
MENKELPAARNAVGALNLEEDPVVAALARVDNLTGILAHLLDDMCIRIKSSGKVT